MINIQQGEPENDPVWEFYLTLRDIVAILFAPEFVPGTEEMLHVLIQEHHTMYQELFRAHFQPKFHYWLHYSHLMTVVGPLLPISTMRWEGKHREMKQVARATSSRINLRKTVLLKCMLKLAYRFLSGDGLRVEFQVGKTVPVRRQIIDPEGILEHYILNANAKIFITSEWLTVCGVYFRVGMVVHTSYDNKYPCFAVIDKIV
ncbi:hypothetical protein FOCC_FOCC000810 [Frankliniella occidentalis]|nr:hypothetical protein FOCC_FOCC000810 [Frankliniella occidentalis]